MRVVGDQIPRLLLSFFGLTLLCGFPHGFYFCSLALCGNGMLDAFETCDDGNIVSGDGCSSVCQTEQTYSCSGEPSTCASCGSPPGTPSVWVDGTDLDGSGNTTLSDSDVFDGTPAITNKGSLGGTFSNGATTSPAYAAGCIGRASSKGCLRFDGTDDLAVSSLAASNFRFLHETDSTCLSVWKTRSNAATGTSDNQVLWATALASVTSEGAVSWIADSQWSSNEQWHDLYDGASPAAIRFTSSSGVYVSQAWSRSIVRYDVGATGDDLSVLTNGTNIGGGEPTTPYAGDPNITLYLGAAWNALYFGGDLYQLICYNSALSDGDRTTLDTWASCMVGSTTAEIGGCASSTSTLCGSQSPCRIGVVGDSLSYPGALTEWPDTLRTNLGGGYEVLNEAVSGDEIETAKTTQWTNRLKPAGVHALILFIGRNDIYTSSETAANVLADVAEVVADATAAGVNVLTISALPTEDAADWSSAKQIQHDAFNAGLISAAGGCRQHLDVYATFEEPTDPDALKLTYDSGDGLHLNQAGQDALEALIEPLIGP